MVKVLILGSNGLLGQNLIRKFLGEYRIFAASNEPQNNLKDLNTDYQQLDITNRTEVRDYFERIEPEVIINTAAWTDVDGCEEDRETCWNINARAVEHIVESAMAIKPILVQLSTDYIFDGMEPPYHELSEPRPQGNYARSKLAAEETVKGGALEYIIARIQVLFGKGVNVRPNFVTWLIGELRQGRRVRIVNDQIGTPSFAPDVAEAIHRLLQNEAYGVYHIASPESLSRYEFALKIADVFDLDKQLIQEITTKQLNQKAPRPVNSSFSIDKLVNYTGWEPHNLNQCLSLLKKELE